MNLPIYSLRQTEILRWIHGKSLDMNLWKMFYRKIPTDLVVNSGWIIKNCSSFISTGCATRGLKIKCFTHRGTLINMWWSRRFKTKLGAQSSGHNWWNVPHRYVANKKWIKTDNHFNFFIFHFTHYHFLLIIYFFFSLANMELSFLFLF